MKLPVANVKIGESLSLGEPEVVGLYSLKMEKKYDRRGRVYHEWHTVDVDPSPGAEAFFVVRFSTLGCLFITDGAKFYASREYNYEYWINDGEHYRSLSRSDAVNARRVIKKSAARPTAAAARLGRIRGI